MKCFLFRFDTFHRESMWKLHLKKMGKHIEAKSCSNKTGNSPKRNRIFDGNIRFRFNTWIRCPYHTVTSIMKLKNWTYPFRDLGHEMTGHITEKQKTTRYRKQNFWAGMRELSRALDSRCKLINIWCCVRARRWSEIRNYCKCECPVYLFISIQRFIFYFWKIFYAVTCKNHTIW